jgi:hypothetical protein
MVIYTEMDRLSKLVSVIVDYVTDKTVLLLFDVRVTKLAVGEINGRSFDGVNSFQGDSNAFWIVAPVSLATLIWSEGGCVMNGLWPSRI